MMDHRTSDPHTVLALSVKAMNDTLGPEGLVPYPLVFGEFPKVHTKSETPNERAVLASRAKLAHVARTKMEKHMAELRVKRALKHSTPSTSDCAYEPGGQVLVWREKQVDNRIGEWLGPFTVLAGHETKRLVFIQDIRVGAARPCNVAQLKLYHAPETLAHSFFTQFGQGLNFFSSPNDHEVHLTEILDKRSSNSLQENGRSKAQGDQNLARRRYL